MAHAAWLKDFIVFLIAAGVVVPIFHRARIGTVLGFLAVGIVVGPFGLGRLVAHEPWLRWVTIDDPAQAEPFAELGVVFLLFLLGLELSMPRLWRLRRYVLGVGAVQVALSTTAISGLIAVLGAEGRIAIVLGLCLALSSTAIVMQLLMEQRRSATPVGRIALSVLLFQDLMVVPILVITGIFARGTDQLWTTFGTSLVEALAAVIAIMVVGRFLLRPLLHFSARSGSRDLIMAITLLIVIGTAMATGASGLSTALGAFIAGLLLSESEYQHQIEVDLEPFKGLLLGLFFMTVGMSIDIGRVLPHLGWLVLAVVALMAAKAAIVYAAARTFRVRRSAAAELSLLLAQAGEFAFVVIGLARGNQLASAEVASFAVAVVGLSMMATPPLALLARRLGARLDAREQTAAGPDDDTAQLEDHIIIGGFGRVGQTIARVLEAENVPFVALDADATLVNAQRKAGRMVYFGDSSRGELLERAGAQRARAFVVTLDAPGPAEQMVSAIFALRPDARVLARAKDQAHAMRLVQRGAVDVIPEAVEASLQLAGRLLEALGLPEDAVTQRLARAREEECGRLEFQATYVASMRKEKPAETPNVD